MTERSSNAWLILENDVFKEAFKSIEDRLTTSWKASHPDQWKERERIFAQLTALQDVKQQLDDFINEAALETTA